MPTSTDVRSKLGLVTDLAIIFGIVTLVGLISRIPGWVAREHALYQRAVDFALTPLNDGAGSESPTGEMEPWDLCIGSKGRAQRSSALPTVLTP